MFLTRKRAFARAGLLGNPSDGYHGKTISFSVRNYWAEVVLYEWDSVEIVLAGDDRAKFDSVQELARDVRLHGYYGGILGEALRGRRRGTRCQPEPCHDPLQASCGRQPPSRHRASCEAGSRSHSRRAHARAVVP